MKKPDSVNVFNIDNVESFNDAALKIFRYQYENNKVYHDFCSYLHVGPDQVDFFEKIPFMPVGFFKTKQVISGSYMPAGSFQSSGTTALTTSRHYYKNLNLYEQSFIRGFELAYGNVRNFCILALLPSYLEQQNSSLIYMINKLIKLSGHKDSGFYLYNYDEIKQKLEQLEGRGQKTILFGVTFALLDLIEKFTFELEETIIMETGGMKGRRKEMVREELHHKLCEGFGVSTIHSEYGMTELFSQAWSKGDGVFECPPWMKILIRDVNDPLSLMPDNKTGAVNIIDLANINSCSFIATQDLGRKREDGSFEVLGRYDHSDVRGCNLLIS